MKASRVAHPCPPPATSLASLGSRHCLFQIISSLANARCNILNDLGNLRDLRFRFSPFLLVHILPHRRDWLCPVTCIGSRRVDLVFEPGTFGKSFFVQEQTRDSK